MGGVLNKWAEFPFKGVLSVSLVDSVSLMEIHSYKILLRHQVQIVDE